MKNIFFMSRFGFWELQKYHFIIKILLSMGYQKVNVCVEKVFNKKNPTCFHKSDFN